MRDAEVTSNPFPLILRSQDGDEGYVVVETTPFRIGRRPENDLRIRHPGVSGLHAEIRSDRDGYSMTDLESTNGTFVNGIRIDAPTPLRTGDILHIGGIGFRVVPEIEYGPEAASRTIPENTSRVKSVIELFRIVHEERTWAAFQPIIDIASREVLGWEALGRPVARSTGGPAPLFKLAEESNAAAGLSAAFRRSAGHCVSCGHCWPATGRKMLFLNLHPDEILVPDFPDLLAEIASTRTLRNFQPVIELPESLVCNTRELVVWAGEIRRCGMLVAYDDFGRGQSRIPDLIQAPPDFLKLDRDLVQDLGKESVKDDLVEAIVAACSRLGARTVAEGIETEEELKACAELGIHCGQGFHLERPKAAFELFGADPGKLPEDCPFVRHSLLPKTSSPELPLPAFRE